MPKLWNFNSNALEEVPDERVTEAVASGVFAFGKGVRVPVVLPNGEPYYVNGEEATKLFNMGARFEGEADRKARYYKREYGEGIGNATMATLAGVARGASIGLSDAAATAIGIDPDRLQAYRQNFPGLSLTGEVVGSVAPVLIPGAQAAPAALLAKGASAVGSGAAKKILGEAAAKGLLAKAGAKALPAGITAALESGAYAAGSQLTEASLGDTEQVADRLFSEVTFSGIVGGALGASISGLGVLGKAGARKAAEGMDEIYRKKVGTKPPEGFGQKVVDYLRVTSGEAPKPPPKDVIRDIEGEIEKHVIRAQKAVTGNKNLFEQLSQITKGEMKREVIRQDMAEVAMPDVTRLASSVLNDVRSILSDAARESAAHYSRPGDINKVSALVDKLQRKMIAAGNKAVGGRSRENFISAKFLVANIHKQKSSEFAVDVYNAVDQFKKDLGDYVRDTGAFRQLQWNTNSVLKAAYDIPRAFLENEAVFGKIGARQKLQNAAFTELLNYQKAYESRFLTQVKRGKKIVKGSSVGNLLRKANRPENLDAREIFVGYNNKLKQYIDIIENEYTLLPKDSAAAKRARRNIEDLKKSIDESKLAADTLNEYRNFTGDFSAYVPDELPEDLPSKMAAYKQTLDLAREHGAPKNFESRSPIAAAILKGGLGYAIGGPYGAVTAIALGDLSRAAMFGKKMAYLASVALQPAVRLSEKVSRLSKKITKPMTSSTRLKAPVGIGQFVKVIAGHEYNEDDSTNDFKKVATRLSLLNDPARQVSLVDSLTKHLEDTPNLRDAMQLKLANAISYLNANMPRLGPTSPFTGREQTPSDTELYRFERIVHAVDQPIDSIMDNLTNGTLTRQEVDAVASVHPMTYNEIVEAVIESVSEIKEPIPYAWRQQLDILLRGNFEPTMRAEFVLSMQAVYDAAKENQPDSSSQKLSTSARSYDMENSRKISLGMMNQSDTQRLESRA